MLDKARIYILLHPREFSFGVIIFTIASLSFGLGYLANREFNHAPIIIEKCAVAVGP